MDSQGSGWLEAATAAGWAAIFVTILAGARIIFTTIFVPRAVVQNKRIEAMEIENAKFRETMIKDMEAVKALVSSVVSHQEAQDIKMAWAKNPDGR